MILTNFGAFVLKKQKFAIEQAKNFTKDWNNHYKSLTNFKVYFHYFCSVK
jgi:hypothetical protein